MRIENVMVGDCINWRDQMAEVTGNDDYDEWVEVELTIRGREPFVVTFPAGADVEMWED
jgi:hypothetical protein